MMHARRKRALMVAIAPTQHADNALALAVESAPETDELELLGHGLGKPERRLDRLGAAGKQLKMREPLRQERGDKMEKGPRSVSREAAENRPLDLLLEALHMLRL